MRLPRPALAVLAVLALGYAAARADDVHKAAEEPDLGFLEFLGSVDRLADVMPDYLQSDPRGKGATGSTPVPPPPPRPAPPPNAPNGPGGHNDG